MTFNQFWDAICARNDSFGGGEPIRCKPDAIRSLAEQAYDQGAKHERERDKGGFLAEALKGFGG